MIVPETADKIKSMEIRGAGRIARAVAEALRDHALSLQVSALDVFRQEMEQTAALLLATRPTAVSLPNAVHMVMAGLNHTKTIEEAKAGAVRCADEFIRSSQHAVEQIGQFGASHIRDGDTILTHCNSEVGGRRHYRGPSSGKKDRGFCYGSAAKKPGAYYNPGH